MLLGVYHLVLFLLLLRAGFFSSSMSRRSFLRFCRTPCFLHLHSLFLPLPLSHLHPPLLVVPLLLMLSLLAIVYTWMVSSMHSMLILVRLLILSRTVKCPSRRLWLLLPGYLHVLLLLFFLLLPCSLFPVQSVTRKSALCQWL